MNRRGSQDGQEDEPLLRVLFCRNLSRLRQEVDRPDVASLTRGGRLSPGGQAQLERLRAVVRDGVEEG